MTQSIEARLRALAIELPAADAARGRYSPAVVSGRTIYLAGQGPTRGQEIVHTGRVGVDLELDQARDAARLSMLNLLAQLRQACQGNLDLVARPISCTVYVNSGPSFFQQPRVADGATDLLADLWGEDRLPARTAVGVFALPMNIAVEVDAVFELAG